MRIILAQVVVAITTQNKRNTHARRILTIPSNQIVEPLGMAQMVENEAVLHPSPHTSLTLDLLSGTCTPPGRLPRTQNAQRLHSGPWSCSTFLFSPRLRICKLSPLADMAGI